MEQVIEILGEFYQQMVSVYGKEFVENLYLGSSFIFEANAQDFSQALRENIVQLENFKNTVSEPGYDANEHDAFGHLPLESLVFTEDYEKACILLNYANINFNAVNFSGENLLMTSINELAPLGLLKYLIERVDINYQEPDDKDTVLISTAKDGYKHIVKAILENRNVDINLQNKKGKTALMYAKHIKMVKLLLIYNANTHIKDAKGRTVLDITQNNKIKQLIIDHRRSQCFNIKPAKQT